MDKRSFFLLFAVMILSIGIVSAVDSVNILDPTGASPKTVTADELIQIQYEYFDGAVEVTSGVTVNEVTINGNPCSISEDPAGYLGYQIFYDDFEEAGWYRDSSSYCSASDPCDSYTIGNFNNCDDRSNDYYWCASSDSSAPQGAYEGTYGLLTGDWDAGAVDNTDGLWYNFDASTSCDGGACDYINMQGYYGEYGLDSGEYCWITEQVDGGTPSAKVSFTSGYDYWNYESFNLSAGALSSSNVNIRIMCDMSSTSDEGQFDALNITGYVQQPATQQNWYDGSNWFVNITTNSESAGDYDLFINASYNTESTDTEANAIHYDADSTPPTVNVVYPTATTYTGNVTDFKYTVSDAGALDSCWNSIDAGATNSTPVSAGVNWTNMASSDGSNTFDVWCNDSFNNIGHDSVTFTREWTSTSVTVCRQLDFSQNYVLQNNVSSTGDCFWINANNVGIDGQGLYRITYATSGAGDGIDSTGFDGLVIKDLDIYQTDTSRTGSCDGVDLEDTHDVLIDNVYMFIEGSDLSSSNGNGVYALYDIVNLTIQNSYIFTDNADGHGVRVTITGGVVGTDINFINSTILTTGGGSSSCSCGFRIDGSAGDLDYVNVINSNISTIGSSSSDALILDSSSATYGHFNITNTYVESLGKGAYITSGSEDMFIRDSSFNSGASDEDLTISFTGNAYAINVSLVDEDEIIAGGGTLFRQWYFDAQVNESGGSPVASATATLWNVSGTQQFSVSTDANGKIAQQITTAYTNAGTRVYYNDHEFNVTKASYVTNSSILNITTNQNLQITLDPEVGGDSFTRAISDSLSFSEAVNYQGSFVRGVSESLSFDAIVSRITAVFRNPSDSFSVSPLVNALGIFKRGVSDSFEIGTSVTKSQGFVRGISDSFSVSPLVQAVFGTYRAVSDSFGIGDSLSRVVSAFRNPSDTISFSPLVNILAMFNRDVSDSFSIGDDIAYRLGFIRNPSDTISVSPLINILANFNRDVSSEIGIDVFVERTTEMFRSVSDSFSIDSVVGRLTFIFRSVSDSFSISDSVSRFRGLFVNVADSFSISDAVGRLTHFIRSFADSIVIQEETIDPTGLKRYFVNIIQSINVDTFVDRTTDIFKNIFDIIGIGESSSANAGFFRSFVDSFSISDSVERIASFFRSIGDIIDFVIGIFSGADIQTPASTDTSSDDLTGAEGFQNETTSDKQEKQIETQDQKNIRTIFVGLLWFLVATFILVIGFLTDILRREKKIKGLEQFGIIIMITIVLIALGLLGHHYLDGRSMSQLVWMIVSSAVVFVILIIVVAMEIMINSGNK